MYCPSCGKQIPEGSQFCLYCGKSISIPSTPIVKSHPDQIQWDYKDYVYTWSHKETWYRPRFYTEAQVRIEVWMNYQSRISSELQRWYDQGWESIGEVGASSIVLNEYTEWDVNAAIVWTIFTAGLALIVAPFMRASFLEPKEFRLKMRRPVSKKPIIPKDSENSYQQQPMMKEREELAERNKSSHTSNIHVSKRRPFGDELTPITKTTNYHGRLALVVGEPVGELGELQCPWCDQEYEISKVDRNVFFKCEKCQNVVLVTHD